MGQLKRNLGTFSLTFYGLGMILGAGIYSVIGAAAGRTGELLWMSFALSAIIILLVALSYAELSVMFPRAGAEYVYLREAFPKIGSVAFTVACFVAISGSATAATVSMAFAGYLNHFVKLPDGLVALAVLCVAAMMAIVGTKESSIVNIIFTVIEVSGLILFVGLGVQNPQFGEEILQLPHSGILTGAAIVFFAYLGFENIANLAEETKAPERTLPRAIFLSVGISTVIYILVALAAVALLDPEKLAASSAPLAAAAKLHSRGIAGALGGIALFATANTALIALITSSRVFLAIARNGELPHIFTKIQSHRKTPWAATLLAFAIGVTLLPLGKVEIIASVSSFSALLAFLGVNAALIKLRFARPKARRVLRVPLNVGQIPVLPVLSIAGLVVLTTQFEARVYVLAGGVLIFLTLVHKLVSSGTTLANFKIGNKN